MDLSIPFYQQNMAELEGLGQFDCVTIFCDSLNYLQREEDVICTFQRVYEHLNEGGLFLFDVHSIYKIEQIFVNHTFAVNDEEVSYIWNCFPGEEPFSVEHDLSFFVKDAKMGLYDRFDEFHYQRTYSVMQYTEWLKQAGFVVLEVLADLEDAPLQEKTERILFIAQKISNYPLWELLIFNAFWCPAHTSLTGYIRFSYKNFEKEEDLTN